MRHKHFPELEAREARIRRKNRPYHACLNCGDELPHDVGHFVPPSLGEDGFYTCVKMGETK